MMSVLMTGYMFRNAQYRLELQQSLEQVALPEPRDQKVIIFSFITSVFCLACKRVHADDFCFFFASR